MTQFEVTSSALFEAAVVGKEQNGARDIIYQGTKEVADKVARCLNQEELKMAYMMLCRISEGKSFSTLQYHANLTVIESALSPEDAARMRELAAKY